MGNPLKNHQAKQLKSRKQQNHPADSYNYYRGCWSDALGASYSDRRLQSNDFFPILLFFRCPTPETKNSHCLGFFGFHGQWTYMFFVHDITCMTPMIYSNEKTLTKLYLKRTSCTPRVFPNPKSTNMATFRPPPPTRPMRSVSSFCFSSANRPLQRPTWQGSQRTATMILWRSHFLGENVQHILRNL